MPRAIGRTGAAACDNDGRLLSALYGSTTGSGIVQGYDGLGRLSSRTVYGRQIGYGYDAAGHRTSLVYPDSYSVTYGYSNAGELLNIVDSNSTTLATYSYDAQGRVTGLARPNSAATTTTPDAISRLQGLQQDLAGTA